MAVVGCAESSGQSDGRVSDVVDAVVGARQVKASWTHMDGLPGLNGRLDSRLLEILDAAAPRGRALPSRNGIERGPGFGLAVTVSAEPVAANGTVIVVREKVSDTGPNPIGAVSSATVYADKVSGVVHGAAIHR
ncbi:hypothetical protein AB6813_05875 [bacterium RCC_150]